MIYTGLINLILILILIRREAIQTILRRWGAKLTLVFEREHAGHILHAIDLARVFARVPAPD